MIKMFKRAHYVSIFFARAYSQGKPSIPVPPVAASPAAAVNANVPGLSKNCVKPANGLVGPGAAPNAAYKVPEYFCFDRFSFAEAEVEMAKFRCPQPSALK